MHVAVACKTCQHRWTLIHEPRALSPLLCPKCAAMAERRAAEDLASSLEDALCQLALLGQTMDLEIALSTRDLPEPFRMP